MEKAKQVVLFEYHPIIIGAVLVGTLIPLGIFIWRYKSRNDSDNNVDETYIPIAIKRFEKSFGQPSSSISILSETCVFEHQVAGHTKEILRSYHGTILKPQIKEVSFRREVKFYENVEAMGSNSLQSPKSFLAKYYGVLKTQDVDGKQSSFIVLEDLIHGFRQPCIMDLKIGRQTYEPTATEAKRLRNKLKYIYQDSIGFRITGYKAYNRCNSNYVSVDKSFGRSLLPNQVKDGLKSFFYDGYSVRKDVIIVVLQRLELLWRWAIRQTHFHFYCSSILVVYDALSIDEDPLAAPEKLVDVRIIDFAHTLNAKGSTDEGYVYGVKSLIQHLEIIMNDLKDEISI